MNIEKQIRKIARSYYWQTLYKASKDCAGINLFKNSYNFSGIQSLFLYWLKIYDMLYDELANKEWENLDEQVIENDIRCDAFLYYRRIEINKKLNEVKRMERDLNYSNQKEDNIEHYKIFKGIKNNGDDK